MVCVCVQGELATGISDCICVASSREANVTKVEQESTAFHEACTAVPWTWDRAGWWMAGCRSSLMGQFFRKHTETRSLTFIDYMGLYRFAPVQFPRISPFTYTRGRKHAWNHSSSRNLTHQFAQPGTTYPAQHIWSTSFARFAPCNGQVDKRHMAETIKLQVWATTLCCWKSCEQFAIASDCPSGTFSDTTVVVSLWSLRHRRVSRASSTTFRTEQIVHIAGSVYSAYRNCLGHTMSARSTASR